MRHPYKRDPKRDPNLENYLFSVEGFRLRRLGLNNSAPGTFDREEQRALRVKLEDDSM